MRNLARRFRGDDNFEDKKDESVLRLLTNPLLRYDDQKAGLMDGAVFALVHGTDPEMIIMIESRKKDGKAAEYLYALAPMTGYELRGYLDKKEVWHKPQHAGNRSTGVFWMSSIRANVGL